MKEKVIFFDIDGTLVDNTYGVHEVPAGVKRELKRIQNDNVDPVSRTLNKKVLKID